MHLKKKERDKFGPAGQPDPACQSPRVRRAKNFLQAKYINSTRYFLRVWRANPAGWVCFAISTLKPPLRAHSSFYHKPYCITMSLAPQLQRTILPCCFAIVRELPCIALSIVMHHHAAIINHALSSSWPPSPLHQSRITASPQPRPRTQHNHDNYPTCSTTALPWFITANQPLLNCTTAQTLHRLSLIRDQTPALCSQEGNQNKE